MAKATHVGKERSWAEGLPCVGLEALLMERIELGHGGDTLTGSFDVSKASFLPSAVCKRDLGHHGICLIHGIMQAWSAEVLSTMTHRDLSQKANVVQSLKIGKGVVGGRGGVMNIKEQRKSAFQMAQLVEGLSLKNKDPSCIPNS